ncbi:hypothetical protein BpHYR1_033758 [Brachionus plicatilis]|uniref:Uncharacterized protein n=1 Tax=Brachionus plicatilis TaxID=10195 RepID=A0A3M7T290_BRAPC|nr:hypothetical protein BpHYR1_033758 [Brachionus plicatilis]
MNNENVLRVLVLSTHLNKLMNSYKEVSLCNLNIIVQNYTEIKNSHIDRLHKMIFFKTATIAPHQKLKKIIFKLTACQKIPLTLAHQLIPSPATTAMRLIPVISYFSRLRQDPSTPFQVSKKTRGRPPLPRDENGKIIRNN